MPSSLKDFKVLAQLGKGSYGSVMKVERIVDGQIYALKEVNIRRLSPREREDALNEIRILASIKSRNIVRYCDAFTEKDNLYIIMEFAEGGDIGRQIEKFKKANKYIKEDTIWSYTIQIARALNEMHSRSILHRDIKPKNVFLTGKNHVRMGDLGCAKFMKTGLARTQIGTPYYMSPEIWNNKPYDGKSDIWAMGCLLYELAMLVPPFLANDMNGLALKVKTTPAARISKHYSDDLANLVASMLNKEPRLRPDVRQILTHPAVTARLATVPDGDDTVWAGDEMRSALLATIRVPAMFGVAGARPLGLALPAPSYPLLKRADSAPGAMGSDAASVASAGSGGGDAAAVGGAGAAAAPMAAARLATPPVPSAGGAPAAPAMMAARPSTDAGVPMAGARAGFAAVTSPPRLGAPGGLRRQGSAPDVLLSAAPAAAAYAGAYPGAGAGAGGYYDKENAYAAQLKAAAAAAGAPLMRVPSSGGLVGAAGAAPVRPLVSAAPAPAARVPTAAAALPSRPPVPSAIGGVGASAAAAKLAAGYPAAAGGAAGAAALASAAAAARKYSVAGVGAYGAAPAGVAAGGGLYGAGARPLTSAAGAGGAGLYGVAGGAAAAGRYGAYGGVPAAAPAPVGAAAGGRYLMRHL